MYVISYLVLFSYLLYSFKFHSTFWLKQNLFVSIKKVSHEDFSILAHNFV